MSKICWDDSLKDEASAQTLSLALDEGRLGHALMMTAADIGTADLAARNLAEGLLGAKLPHADFVWAAPEGKLRQIKVDPMRELRMFLQKASLTGTKVAHISECDRLNDEAANLFLKILEEPPEGTYIILTTTQPHAVLPTILSRAMRFRWGSADISRQQLEGFAQSFTKVIVQMNTADNLAQKELLAMEFLAEAFPLWQGPEEKELLQKDPAAQQLDEGVRAARLSGLKKAHRLAILGAVEQAILESFKKAPQSGRSLTDAMAAVERVRRLMEFSFNEAAGLELVLRSVARALSA